VIDCCSRIELENFLVLNKKETYTQNTEPQIVKCAMGTVEMKQEDE
jgi:hypothetical protein